MHEFRALRRACGIHRTPGTAGLQRGLDLFAVLTSLHFSQTACRLRDSPRGDGPCAYLRTGMARRSRAVQRPAAPVVFYKLHCRPKHEMTLLDRRSCAAEQELYAANDLIQIRSGKRIGLKFSVRLLRRLFQQAGHCRERHPLNEKSHAARAQP